MVRAVKIIIMYRLIKNNYTVGKHFLDFMLNYIFRKVVIRCNKK